MQPELLKYHPNRYYQSRRFFRPMYNQFRSSAGNDGTLAVSAYRGLCEKFTYEYWNAELERFSVEERPPGTRRMVEEQSMFAHVARFTLCGRNIFHISQGLVGLLRMTDVEDVFWDSIKLPYSSLYIWFGPQEGWSLTNSKYHVDGAYVSEFRGHGIEMLLTTQCAGIDYSNPPSFVVHRDVYYYFPFGMTDKHVTVGQTLERTIATDDSFNPNYQAPELDENAYRTAAKAGVALIQMPRGESAQTKSVEHNLSGLPVFRDVLKLLINCLCYLSSPSREVVQRYPAEALTSSDATTTAKELKRERQRLAKEGYTKINFCGESLDAQFGSLATGKELAPHWRRGHWRNQAVGARRSEHKLMWIRPTLVRKDKADEKLLGHVYDVRSTRRRQ